MIDRKMVPVLVSNTDRNSEIFQLFAEYWGLVKEFSNGKDGHREKVYWDELVSKAEDMSKKYDGQYKQFCIDLLVSLIVEMERRDKEERQSIEEDLQIKQPIIDTGKDSKIFQFFSEYWKMIKNFLNGKNGHRESDYWNDLKERSDQITEKYNGEYEKELVMELIEELKRREKKEVQMYIQNKQRVA